MDSIDTSLAVGLKLVELVVDPTKADSVDHPVTTAEERNQARRRYADSLGLVLNHLANLASIAHDQSELDELAKALKVCQPTV